MSANAFRAGERRSTEPQDALANLSPLVEAWAQAPRPGGRGRIVLFASADEDQGAVSTRGLVARTFAQRSAQRTRRPVWLIDLDLRANSQFAHLARERAGAAGQRALDLSLGRQAFWRVTPHMSDQEGRVMSLNPCAPGNLFVSRWHGARVPVGARVRLNDAAEYWRTARRAADLIVIDTPARVRTAALSALARHGDAVILTGRDEPEALRAAGDLRESIVRSGARVAGLVLVADERRTRSGL